VEQTRHVVFESEFFSISNLREEDFAGEPLPHIVANAGIIFVRSGILASQNARGTVMVDANYMLRISQPSLLYRLPFVEMPCACTVLRFRDPSLVNAFLAEDDCTLSSPRAVLLQARIMREATLRPQTAQLDDAARDLASDILATPRRSRSNSFEYSEVLRTIQIIVNQTLADPLSLSEIASRTYLSPFTVSRTFHRQNGISLRCYVKRLRLRAALNFMLHGSRSLTEIAAELGFYDEAHFSKAFHAEFGVAPALAFA